MTVVTFVSIKGAPGVTTLSCLVGATWPEGRRVAVVEADPFGGDLAARFRLTTLCGWTSYAAASRRSEVSAPVDPHLQLLPGGLEVLVGASDGTSVVSVPLVEALLERSAGTGVGALDLLVDCGRLLFAAVGGTNGGWAPGRLPSPDGVGAWLDHADLVVVVTRRDPPSILKVQERARQLTERYGDRLCLVVVGRGTHDNAAIQEFTGLPVIGEVPIDILAGQVASGGDGSGRHLTRSSLVGAARRLAEVLATPGGLTEAAEPGSGPDRGHVVGPDRHGPAAHPAPVLAKRRVSVLTGIARITQATGLGGPRRWGRSARRPASEVGAGPAQASTLGVPRSTPPGGLDPDHLEQGARQ